MTTLELGWREYMDWEETIRRGEITFVEDAPVDVWESLRLYQEQWQEIDERTTRIFIIPKTEEGLEKYESGEYLWEEATYETDDLILFHIPYSEMCTIRERLLEYNLDLDDFHEDIWPRYIHGMDNLINMLEGSDTISTLQILKRSKEYKLGCLFDEEHII